VCTLRLGIERVFSNQPFIAYMTVSDWLGGICFVAVLLNIKDFFQEKKVT
jgi:hypothetical protein